MNARNRKKSNNTLWLVIAAVVVAVVAALVVAVVAGGSDDDTTSGNSSDSTSAPTPVAPGSAAENQPVEVNGSILVPLSDGAVDAAVGQKAPGLKGSSFDGGAVSVAPGDGGYHLVIFVAHWCQFCNAELPILAEWNASGLVPSDLSVTGVSTAVNTDRPNYPPSRWLQRNEWPWPVMADSAEMTAAEAYGVSGYPFMVMIDPDGVVLGRTSGLKELPALRAWVDATLGR